MQKSCKQCGNQFEITDDDLKFYDKISPVFLEKKYLIPLPTLCPDCRQQRRLAFRNERKLYHRKCDLTGKQIISMYSPAKDYKVYDQEAWWSDKWDGLDYGQDFDFNRSFFDQFQELFRKVPKISLINKEHENSEYCNFAWRNKNSYLLFTCGRCQDSYYTNRSFDSRNICDCSNVTNSELCYEVIDSNNCYHGAYLQNCADCVDCFFGINLKNCKNCFACHGLVQAEYCLANKQLTKEEYEARAAELKKDFGKVKELFERNRIKMICKYIDGINIENCTGGGIYNSKNALNCFEVKDLEDCKFVCNATCLKDSYDVNNDDHSELVYEAVGSEANYQHIFNDICWFDKNIAYCSSCFHSQNLFGCAGLKKNQYCILNKQYSKEEYEKLVPKIIDYMIKIGEWGEFFPVEISLFGYNETVANEYFFLTEEQALTKEFRWHDEEATEEKYVGPKVEIPDKINEVDESVCKQILTCEITGKHYKIIPQELKFYKKMGLPIPRKCPDQRYKERMNLRNPRKLWKRNCMKCGKGIETTYPPPPRLAGLRRTGSQERPETVYCEECYLKEVY